MSLPEQPDTTLIRRLTVRGPSGTRERLLPQLEAAHWPAPPDHSWILVRRVAASASKSSLVEELLQKTQQRINSRDPAEVICFPTLAALLAALITDIYKGIAPQRWYWQRWSRLWQLPAGDAIQHLLQEHPRQLVAVCHHLSANNQLKAVWLQLSRDNASALLGSIRYELGLAPTAGNTGGISKDSGAARIPVPEQQVQAWHPVFTSLPETDPRLKLALMIIATDSAPLALCAAPGLTLAMIRQQLTPPRANREPASGRAIPPVEKTQKSDYPQEIPPQRKTEPVPLSEVGSGPGPRSVPAPVISLNHPGNQASAEISEPGTQQEALNQNTVTPPATRENLEQHRNHQHSGNIRTAMAGTLYLLNVLNRPAIQSIMAEAWQSLPNGWAWLYQLARELDLDPNDSLCEFLAERLGLDSATDLKTLPRLPERQRVLSLVAQWFHQEDLWSPALIRGPGELVYTPGYLDLYQDNSQVRLEVRLAGLDLNPGWLPWLGTVVTFHFDHFPHLKGAAL